MLLKDTQPLSAEQARARARLLRKQRAAVGS
jgi:hypothetical protein